MNGHLLVAGNRTWWSWTSRARRPMAMCGLQLLVKVRDILKWRCQLNFHSMLCFARLHKLQAKPNSQQIVKPIWLSPAWVGNCFPLRVLAKRFCMTLNWQLEQVHTSETIIKTGIMCSHLVVHSNPSMILAAGRVSNTEHHSCRSLMDKLDLNTGDIRKGMELPSYKRCRIHYESVEMMVSAFGSPTNFQHRSRNFHEVQR